MRQLCILQLPAYQVEKVKEDHMWVIFWLFAKQRKNCFKTSNEHRKIQFTVDERESENSYNKQGFRYD